jgi:hypothetical protein
MLPRLFSLIALLFISTAVFAQQEAPVRFQEPVSNYQVYGGYSYLSNSLNGVPGSKKGLSGFDASVAFPHWHALRFKIDFSSYRGTNLGSPQHPYFIVGGAQYEFRLHRETVFIEGLGGVGGANKTWGTGGAQGQTASFAAVTGGGLDTRITRHMAVRIEGDFQYSYFELETTHSLIPYRIPGLPTDFGRATGGLVWNF